MVHTHMGHAVRVHKAPETGTHMELKVMHD